MTSALRSPQSIAATRSTESARLVGGTLAVTGQRSAARCCSQGRARSLYCPGLDRALTVTHVLRKIWMAADRHGSDDNDVMLFVTDGRGERWRSKNPPSSSGHG